MPEIWWSHPFCLRVVTQRFPPRYECLSLWQVRHFENSSSILWCSHSEDLSVLRNSKTARCDIKLKFKTFIVCEARRKQTIFGSRNVQCILHKELNMLTINFGNESYVSHTSDTRCSFWIYTAYVLELRCIFWNDTNARCSLLDVNLTQCQIPYFCIRIRLFHVLW